MYIRDAKKLGAVMPRSLEQRHVHEKQPVPRKKSTGPGSNLTRERAAAAAPPPRTPLAAPKNSSSNNTSAKPTLGLSFLTICKS